MQNISKSDVTNWINNASPTDLFPVLKQGLSRIGTLPPNERDQFTREVGNDQSVAKLFNAHA